MKFLAKRLTGIVLILSMLLPEFATMAVVQDSPQSNESSQISFSASKYTAMENEGEFEITVVREGNTDNSVSVAFKAADFLAEYGVDYIVYDSDGVQLPLTEGIAPDAEDFKPVGSGETDNVELSGNSGSDFELDSVETSEEFAAGSSYAGPDNWLADNTEDQIETENNSTPAEIDKNNTSQTTRKDSGSSLMNAQAEYLDLPDENLNEISSIENALEDVHEYFESARGAMGIITFEPGETEKTLTVELIDNSKAQADKVVLFALMGVNGDENTLIEANPTAYLTIIDDEKYETPVIYPEFNEITLTEDESAYSLKLLRDEGVDYYTSVTVYTVKETAAEGVDYDRIDNVKISFVPGETEKTVNVTAKAFDKDSSFGIRIEGDETCRVENEYVRVYINKSEKENLAPESENDVELMAVKYAGSATTTTTLNELGLVTGPTKGSQDGWSRKSYNSSSKWYDYGLYETYKNSGRTWISNEKTDLTGVDYVNFPHQNIGEHSFGWGNYHLYIEALSDAYQLRSYYSNPQAAIPTVYDNHGWTYTDMDVRNLNGVHYFRFGGRNDGTAADNFEVWFGNPVTFKWRLITFDTAHSPQYFERFSYDYDSKTGQKTKIPFTDGGNDYVYYPGEIYLADNSGNQITGFYGNANTFIKPVAKNAAANEKLGIELEGVYLYVKNDAELYNKNLKAPFDDIWTTDKTVWIPSSGVTLNQEFQRQLFSVFGKNLTSVKVMPKYKQREVKLNLYKADNDETYIANMDDNTDGADIADGAYYYIKSLNSNWYLADYSSGLQISIPISVIQSYKIDKYTKWKLVSTGDGYYNIVHVNGHYLDVSGAATANGTRIQTYESNGTDAQKFKLQKLSDGSYVIYTKVSGNKSCVDVSDYSTKAGANVHEWQYNGTSNQKWILEKVENFVQYSFPLNSVIKMRAEAAPKKTITGFTLVGASGTRPYTDDNAPEKISLTITENTNLYPKTEAQGMNVAYMPGALNKPSDLTNVVYRMPSVVDAETTTETTDKNGDLNIETVYSGMQWIMAVNAPKGKIVKWTNGTGDIKNVNGAIDVSPDPTINEKNENTDFGLNRGLYSPVYGNVMAGIILQNNTKYYYEFEDINSEQEKRIRGQIYRENGTFRDIVLGKELGMEPLSNSIINVAGTAGNTDSNGYFDMTVAGIPISGYVSLVITDPESGTTYTTTALANYMYAVLPAYECFKPAALSVVYGEKTHTISGTAANIYDDTLTVIASVDNCGQLVAREVKFYIVKNNGITIDCALDSRFKISFANGTASLEFNPMSVMDTGDKIYVSFVDQNGKEYKKMDIGYDFVKPLSLKEFLFPLIGSSLIEDIYESDIVTELIGDPLGDISLGKIGFDDPVTSTILPPGIDDTQYEYIRSIYKYGDFNQALKTFKSKETEDKDQATEGNKSETTADNLKDAANEAGKDTQDAAYKTQNSFTWEFSVKAAFGFCITTRQDEDGEYRYYFEELDFLVGADYDVDGEVTITLPIGMNVIVSGKLSGDVTGIYQLKTDYTGDPTWSNNKVEYSTESFGLFKEIDNVNRYVYLMLNPNIRIGLDLNYSIVTVGGGANFSFDMDFRFGLNKNKMTTKMYGDMTYWFDYHVKVLSFNVYEGKTEESTVKLFSQNANGHFDPDIMEGLLNPDGGEAELSSTLMSRDYLENSTEFSGESLITLFDIDATEGTVEQVLQNGVYPDAKYKAVVTGEDTALLVFIGDVPDRSAANRTGLYYSVYDGAKWSTPVLVDDDGTLDDYPEAFDLGDKVLIAWSSADRVLDDGVTVQEALSSLDIKTVFYDKETGEFDEVVRLTHTTEQDYTADVMPKAAYDESTGKVILYYTKTEYNEAVTTEDLLGNPAWESEESSGSPSVIAYRFYENGTWNGAEDYTDEELEGVADKEAYKENWYGQRFLDTRLNKDSGEMLRIVDTDAISYNGLSIYAWTVDYDKDLNTTNDRDVFMQIYNFDENSFTHVIRVTAEAGAYAAPHFGRYNDNTYLFFSAIGDLGNGEDAGSSGIAYINITEPIKNGRFTLVSENNTEYYKLQYTSITAPTVSADGTEIPSTEETILIKPQYAVTFNGYVNNYSVDIDENERMYLTWSDIPEGKENQRQLFTSVYDVMSDGSEEKVYSDSVWSEPFVLTGAENTGYTDVDTFVLNGKLYAVANKAPYTEGESGSMVLDENSSSMVIVEHTPYSKLVSDEENALSADTGYIYEGKEFVLTSSVKNEGVKLVKGPVTFKFTMTAGGETTDLGTVVREEPVGGGKTSSASITVPALDELPDDLTFNVAVSADGSEFSQEMKLVKEYSIVSDGVVTIDRLQGGIRKFSLNVENIGNISSDDVRVVVYTLNDGERTDTAADFDVGAIEADSMAYVSGVLDIRDSMYTIDENGLGTVDLAVCVTVAGKEIYSFTTQDGKSFDKLAIDTLSKVESFDVQKNIIAAKPGEQIEIVPNIAGDLQNEDVKVIWQSDNTDAVMVNDFGEIFAIDNGSATLTGYLVPAVEMIVFDANANTERNAIPDNIPDNLIKTAQVKVNVNNKTTIITSGGDSKPVTVTYQVTFETNGAGEIGSVEVVENGVVSDLPTPVKEGFTFDGWFTDTALTVPFDSQTKITSDITLYAKWTEISENPDISDSWENPFKDVSTDDWFYENVKYAYENKIFNGVTDTEFAPNSPLTRAMLVTVLYRVEGEPDTQKDSGFDDVSKDSYYSKAVAWAKENGIVNGITETEFAPDANISREQIAAIIYRYAKFKNQSPTGAWAIKLDYADFADISDWAAEAVMYCKLEGIMQGDENNEFKPKDDATRAQAAAIIQRFLECIEAEKQATVND